MNESPIMSTFGRRTCVGHTESVGPMTIPPNRNVEEYSSVMRRTAFDANVIGNHLRPPSFVNVVGADATSCPSTQIRRVAPVPFAMISNAVASIVKSIRPNEEPAPVDGDVCVM